MKRFALILIATILLCFSCEKGMAQEMAQDMKEQSKNRNTTHSVGLNASFDFRVDILFSFSQNGLLNEDGYNKGKKNLSPLWNLIPYYELGVNNIFFFKLEHFCTYKYKYADPYARNHSIYTFFRVNILFWREDQKHKLLVGGMLGTNIYRNKLEKEIGFDPILFLGPSIGYYYNFAGNFNVYCSADMGVIGFWKNDNSWFAIKVGKDYELLPFSFGRISFGLQYTFNQ